MEVLTGPPSKLHFIVLLIVQVTLPSLVDLTLPLKALACASGRGVPAVAARTIVALTAVPRTIPSSARRVSLPVEAFMIHFLSNRLSDIIFRTK